MEIYSGLTSSCIRRLKATWGGVQKGFFFFFQIVD